jgi:peptidyl-prolyl cis-trans isomerase C
MGRSVKGNPYIIVFAICLLLTACKAATGSPRFTPSPEFTSQPAASPTPLVPSPTPVPLAALVNGEPITLAAYQTELVRYSAALGRELTPEDNQHVMQEMIDGLLLSQSAVKNGFIADEALVQSRINALIQRLGSQEPPKKPGSLADLEKWLANNGYTDESFRQDLAHAVQAAWMRDQVVSQTPRTAEQAHAQQILLSTPEQANEILGRLQAGANFATLASEIDPVTAGELGWFPRGYLFYPELEAAIFALQPGQYTAIIQTAVGYHIVELIELDPQRPLSPDALLQLQKQTLSGWITEQRRQSDIQIFAP